MSNRINYSIGDLHSEAMGYANDMLNAIIQADVLRLKFKKFIKKYEKAYRENLDKLDSADLNASSIKIGDEVIFTDASIYTVANVEGSILTLRSGGSELMVNRDSYTVLTNQVIQTIRNSGREFWFLSKNRDFCMSRPSAYYTELEKTWLGKAVKVSIKPHGILDGVVTGVGNTQAEADDNGLDEYCFDGFFLVSVPALGKHITYGEWPVGILNIKLAE